MNNIEELLKNAETMLLSAMLGTKDLYERKNLARALDALHNAQEYVQQARMSVALPQCAAAMEARLPE